tara:strand:+ start:15312 stop:15710 length:399 start_codon:yes stop_codon:yes gene_type:complete
MIHKLLLIACLLVSSPKGIDSSKVRHGKLAEFKEGQKVYLVDSKKVYVQMEPYKTITREGLKKGSARYNILMRRCTTLYKATLGKSEYSLIVEIGGVDKTLHKTEDVTTKIISLLTPAERRNKNYESLLYTF